MEPVTHVLTGVCLARSGLNRKAAYATVTVALAAEFPDIDELWSLRGPVEGFLHHRGITHTFLGLPFEAALLVAAMAGVHHWRRRGRRSPAQDAMQAGAAPASGALANGVPVRWGRLYLCALAGLLSHLLLDYTNNYGIRPFFPFDRHWYAASIVFIVDPVILALLAMALLLPQVFALVGAEIGAKRPPFRGTGWARAALVGLVLWWGLRWVQHDAAVRLAMQQSVAEPQPALAAGPADVAAASAALVPRPDEPPPVFRAAQRALASPDPLNPFHWSAAVDFGTFYQIAEIDTRSGAVEPAATTYAKLFGDKLYGETLDAGRPVAAAERSPLGRAYLDWSPMPILTVARPLTPTDAAGGDDSGAGDPGAAGLTVVTFRDPRFMGGWMKENVRSALTGTVSLDARARVVRQTLDGRAEP